MAKQSKVPTGFLKSLQTAASGISTAWPASVTSVVIDQTSFTPATLLTKVQGYVTVFAAPELIAKQHVDSITTREETYQEAHDFLVAFFSVLVGIVGKSATGLAPFGKAPPKQRTTPTAAQSALTTEKRNATRKARGTTSKKQKSTIHGTLPTTATAATTAAAPATATTATTAATTTTGS